MRTPNFSPEGLIWILEALGQVGERTVEGWEQGDNIARFVPDLIKENFDFSRTGALRYHGIEIVQQGHHLFDTPNPPLSWTDYQLERNILGTRHYRLEGPATLATFKPFCGKSYNEFGGFIGDSGTRTGK